MRLLLCAAGLAISAVHALAAAPAVQSLAVSNPNLAIDTGGNVYVAGIAATNQLRVVKLDPQGGTLASWTSTTGDYQVVNRMALDPGGNLLVTGVIWPAVGFVNKFDAGLTKLVSRLELPANVVSIGGLAINSQGNIYIGGSWLSTGPGQVEACRTCVFLGDLTPEADSFIYYTLYPPIAYDSCTLTVPGSCASKHAPGNDETQDIAIDPAGNVLFAGSGYLPLVAFSADMQSQLWFLDAGPLHSMALTSDGDLWIAGDTGKYFGDVSGNGFIARLDQSHAIVFKAPLAGSSADSVQRLRLDSFGNIWASGWTTSTDFPALPGTAPGAGGFLVQMTGDGLTLLQSYRFPDPVSDFVVRPEGGAIVVGPSGWLYRVGSPMQPQTGILGINNLLATVTENQVSPGEFVHVMVASGGPAGTSGAVFDSSGKLSSTLQGSRVTFDGVAAPLLQVTPTTLDAIVPFELAGRPQTVIRVEGQSGVSDPITVQVGPCHLAVLAVANSDGTPNSVKSPAAAGSILTLYLNGVGTLEPPLSDGSIAPDGKAVPTSPVTVSFAYFDSYTQRFEGSAPGQVAGVLQVNIPIPNFLKDETYLNVSAKGCPTLTKHVLLKPQN